VKLKSACFAFILLVLAGSHAALAQKVYRVSALIGDDQFLLAVEGFKKKLTELGYREGRNIEYQVYSGKADPEVMNRLANKLVAGKPDLIVTSSTTATVPVAKLTEGTNLPVIFLSAADPLRFVKSYASSGNNITGISASALDLIAKRLELLRELAPWAKRVASLNNPRGVNYQSNLIAVREAAKRFGFTILELNATNQEEAIEEVSKLSRKTMDALLLPVDATLTAHIDAIVKECIQKKLPLFPPAVIPIDMGGLATYGPDFFSLGQQGAVLAEKIFRGVRPADLAIEQPYKLNLAINLRTAKAIGLKIPNEILLRADQVIE